MDLYKKKHRKTVTLSLSFACRKQIELLINKYSYEDKSTTVEAAIAMLANKVIYNDYQNGKTKAHFVRKDIGLE